MVDFYREDILGDGFEQRTIELRADYEGEAVAVLVRRLSAGQQQDKAILYIHGFNDYFFQSEMAHWFNRNGFNFYAIDLRKYGRAYMSHQKFNDIRNLKDYYEEITAALSLIRSEGNKETVLMGHSTGGLIVTLYAKDNPQSLLYDGLVLNSPFFDFNLSKSVKFFLPVIAWLGKYFPKIKISGGFSEKYGESIHKDYGGEWEYNLLWKPNVAPKINIGWLRAIYEGQRELNNDFEIAKPVLVLHSLKSVDDLSDLSQVTSCDAILNVEDIKRIACNIKSDVQITAIPGGLHDLVLSAKTARTEVYNVIESWLKKKNLY